MKPSEKSHRASISNSLTSTTTMSVGGARKSITDKLWEQGRRMSAATMRAGDKLLSKAATGLTDCQKFAQCARLDDVRRLKLICADNQVFESLIAQFSITGQFSDVPFLVYDVDNDLPVFKAILTQHEGFVLQDLTGEFIFNALLCDEAKNFPYPTNAEPPTGYQQRASLQQPETVGKVKNVLGVTTYRIVQAALRDGRRHSRPAAKALDASFYAVVKINDEKEFYVKISAGKPWLYRLAKFFGLAMDSRVFECTRSDHVIGKIRPKLGWHGNNIGYCTTFEQTFNNYTLKAVCLGYSMWAFMKFGPVKFPVTTP
uniref:Uncharacterized protein n=1 Tax=Romanomermis culicivorax TaxID=13658 RepID=A0A915J9H5_ROMCU